MKKLILLSIVTAVSLICLPVQAERTAPAGPSQRAYERASDQAIFNRVSDWFATIGRSQEKREEILEKRQAHRLEQQTQKKARQAQKEAKKRTRELQSRGRQKTPSLQ